SAARFGEPVPEDLIGGKPALLQPLADRVRRFAVPAAIAGGEFRGGFQLVLHKVINLTAKAWAIPQHPFDLRSCVDDCRAPSGAGLHSRGGLKFKKVTQDTPELRSYLPAVGFSQTFDLLRQVLPIERQVRAFGTAQGRRLLLGPQKEILIIELVDFGHLRLRRRNHEGSEGGSQAAWKLRQGTSSLRRERRCRLRCKA